MAITEIFRDEFTTITIDSKGPLVRSVRSDVPFPSLEALEIAVSNQIRTFDELGRVNRVLCIDLRAVMGRNDAEFEERIGKLRLKLYGGFLRLGVLVRSSVGALQVKRLVQADGLARMVTTDEAALLDYLLNG
jgi:hypothetical protein